MSRLNMEKRQQFLRNRKPRLPESRQSLRFGRFLPQSRWCFLMRNRLHQIRRQSCMQQSRRRT